MERDINEKKAALAALAKKLSYLRRDAEYSVKPFLYRLFHRGPKDPSPETGLATLAYDASVRVARGGVYRNWDNLCYIHTSYNYQQDAYLPLCTMTILLNGTYYQERKALQPDGSVIEWGIEDPLSKCGVTGRCAPEDLPEPDVAKKMFADFDDEVEQFRKAVREVNFKR